MPTVTRFGDLNGPYASLVHDLTHGRVTAQSWCHLDPDINPNSLPRRTGWRGALGQVSTAQAHLANQNIQVGDLFIFWGLFRPVKFVDRWQFIGKPEHRIWGWLQVAEIIELGPDGSHAIKNRPWLSDHPHTRPGWSAPNVLYLASEQLDLESRSLSLPGSGVLEAGYLLSAVGETTSTWRAPDWLNPQRGGSGMTYHPPDRWNRNGTVRSAARGQEFVAEPSKNGNAVEWLAALFHETQS